MGDLLAEAKALCLDDYESPDTIARELGERIGRSVTAVEARAALLSLVVGDELRVFVFDTARQDFAVATTADIASGVDLWFLGTR